MIIPANARLCHLNDRHGLYVGRVCPLCPRPSITEEAAALPNFDGLNAGAVASQGEKWAAERATVPSVRPNRATLERKARAMNQTETRFFGCLESQRLHRDDIIRYEGITLRFNADGEHVPSRYTPDFFVREYCTGKLRCIEVKGKQIWPKDLEKFKGARAAWGTVFEFELWQWKDGTWTRLY